MKRVYKFDLSSPLPIVTARVSGTNRNRPISLVLDTGAFMTQLTTSVIEELGYSARDWIEPITVSGPSGPLDEGYTVKISQMRIFGKQFSDLLVAVYDFSNLEKEGIDGLLGFDIVKPLHLEMNGPKGELVILDH